MSPVAPTKATSGQALPIDPRIRARRATVARGRGRRRRVAAAVVATVVVVAGALLAAAHSSLLGVHRVRVSGAVRTGAASVVRASGLGSHPPMIDVNGARVARRVEALPWVRTAAVSLSWPSTVVVRVVERVPVAQMRTRAGSWAEVGSGGRVLVVAKRPASGLLAVTGVDPPAAPGRRASPQLAGALAVASALGPDLDPRVSVVTVTAGGDLSLSITQAPGAPSAVATVALGPPTELAAKLEALRTLAAEVDLRGVRSIDLRVPQVPALTRG